MAMTHQIDELWSWALEDAGLHGAKIDLIELPAQPEPDQRGVFSPPGDPGPGGDVQRTRVALFTGLDEGRPETLLGMMRHHLEYARVLEFSEALYRLSLNVGASLSPVYSDKGKGGGLVWNAIPMMRSANASAARLVTEKFGPQFGRYRTEFGILFRPDHDPAQLGDLACHTTVFGALWPAALEDHYNGQSGLDQALGAADGDAPAWWHKVRQDATFQALSKSVIVFTPTSDEIAAFGGAPAEAWRPLEGLIDRAHRYGLALLGRS
jgi:hypothetical protein